MDKCNKSKKFTEVETDSINCEGQMIRHESDIDHIQNLALSINRVGLLNPINVIKDNGSYKLVAGFHRLEAVKHLKWDKIPCTVLDSVPGGDVKSVALVENIVGKAMTIDEECQAINNLVTEQKLSTTGICSLLGKSRDYVLRRQMAMQLHKDVRDRLFDGDISLGVAEELGKVTDERSRGYILWQAVQSKLSVSEVRDIARIYLESPTIQEAVERGEQALHQISEAKTPQKTCDVCNKFNDYRNLINIWVCRNGCDPQSQEELEKGVEHNG